MLLELIDRVEVRYLENRQRLTVNGCVSYSPPLHHLLEHSQVGKASGKLFGEPCWISQFD